MQSKLIAPSGPSVCSSGVCWGARLGQPGVGDGHQGGLHDLQRLRVAGDEHAHVEALADRHLKRIRVFDLRGPAPGSGAWPHAAPHARRTGSFSFIRTQSELMHANAEHACRAQAKCHSTLLYTELHRTQGLAHASSCVKHLQPVYRPGMACDCRWRSWQVAWACRCCRGGAPSWGAGRAGAAAWTTRPAPPPPAQRWE